MDMTMEFKIVQKNEFNNEEKSVNKKIHYCEK